MNTPKEAFVYCRVSSSRQLKEGHGNDAQEDICRKFAIEKGWRVLNVYKEPGISGSTTRRVEMDHMLADLKKRYRLQKDTLVIIDDLKRFARDMGAYLELKKIVTEAKAKLASPKFNFEDTSPEGEFFELMMVLHGQLERKQNQRQVVEKMKARLERGYWCFPDVPPGYKLSKNKLHGKLAIPIEPQASIVSEAFEGWVSGKLLTQTDVRNFLQARGLYGAKKITVSQARRILDRSLFYSGWIEYRPWNVRPRQGHHKHLISYETHVKTQEKLYSTTKTNRRSNDNPDFPLRRKVLCSKCLTPITGSWVKGRSKLYPTYWCRKNGCSYYGKSIPRANIEDSFLEILKKMRPTPETVRLAQEIVLSKWDTKIETLQKQGSRLQSELRALNKQIDSLMNRAASTTSSKMAETYELKIEELDSARVLLEEKITKKDPERFDIRTAMETITSFLSDPHKTWQKGDFKDRQRVLEMCFIHQPQYNRDDGFRTVDLSLTYAFISDPLGAEISGCGYGRN